MSATGHVIQDAVRSDTPDSVSLPQPKDTEGQSVEKEPSKARSPQHTQAAEPPSSPLSSASNPFSEDEPADIFSPPSSPPARRRLSSTPPVLSRKPTFAFLSRKRKRAEPDVENDMPLLEIPLNATHMRKALPLAKKPRLTQMRIDLGGEIQRTCKGCGMEYVPSNEEDAALHKSFHGLNINGVDLGKGFVKDAGTIDRLDDRDSLVLVDSTSSAGVRKKVRKVLDVVKTDLGAVEIEDERLWGTQERNCSKIKVRMANGKVEGSAKVFLYCIRDKCVGLCLAERIRSASKIVETAADHPNGALVTEPSVAPMLLGISRIWTSHSHRRKGIASVLLDTARLRYFYGVEVPKKMVAFSQPTESGSQLAKRWFGSDGEQSGKFGTWHVYSEAD